MKLRWGLRVAVAVLDLVQYLRGRRALPARLLDAGFEFTAPTIDVALARALSGRGSV